MSRTHAMLSPGRGAEIMMKVGVQLQDTGFAQALVQGLGTEGRNLFFSFVDDFTKDEDYDLILTDREIGDKKHIQLVNHPEETRIYEGIPYRMFRYTHARDFVSGLLYIFHHETGRNLEFAGDTCCKTLAFVSLMGDWNTTALALTTGEILYKHFGYRCLYLNLCPIDGSKHFLPEGSDKGFLKLLYYLSQDRDFPLSSFIRQHSCIDYVDTSIANPYFDELDNVLLHRLLKKIDDMGKYTYLILDVGNHLSRGNKMVLSRAEKVFLVSAGEEGLPAPFFQKATHLLEPIVTDRSIQQISLDRQLFTKKETAACFEENGLLDLSSMKYIQWEAGRLVKRMMEQNNND